MNAVSQALQLMALGLPVMFGVIILFMVLTRLLLILFPYEPEKDES